MENIYGKSSPRTKRAYMLSYRHIYLLEKNNIYENISSALYMASYGRRKKRKYALIAYVYAHGRAYIKAGQASAWWRSKEKGMSAEEEGNI